jgi:NAD(P)-dependent dehydrogenase (short-subunit alcohol dehydrogenase family)
MVTSLHPERVAFITGGAAGFGMASGEALGAQGAAIVVADVDGARAAATADRPPADSP